MWKWFKEWVGEGPPRPDRTLDEMQEEALHITAKVQSGMRPGPFKVTEGEYITLLKNRQVDFIYEHGRVQVPTYWGMTVEVKAQL